MRSVQFGSQITTAPPGSARGLYLVVSDIVGARDELSRRGAEVSDVFHAGTPGAQFQLDDASGRVPGRAPKNASYASFATFVDPDGNGWLLQEVTTRLPGRVRPSATTFGSVEELASALRRAEAAHGEHERRLGARGRALPDWYADFLARDQAGAELPR